MTVGQPDLPPRLKVELNVERACEFIRPLQLLSCMLSPFCVWRMLELAQLHPLQMGLLLSGPKEASAQEKLILGCLLLPRCWLGVLFLNICIFNVYYF